MEKGGSIALVDCSRRFTVPELSAVRMHGARVPFAPFDHDEPFLLGYRLGLRLDHIEQSKPIGLHDWRFDWRRSN